MFSLAPVLSNNLSTGKDIRFSIEARQKMLDGVEKLSKTVAATLGPKGRNVAIAQSWGQPKITKDGVTVAKSVELSDPCENIGAQLVKNVASITNDVAGDGTTTATVLTAAIFKAGCKAVASGLNPMDLKRGIDAAQKRVVEVLDSVTKKCTTIEDICSVATISANGDKEIGDLIAKAMSKVGKEGVITVEEGKTLDNQLEVVEGLKFERGFISPYFITDTKTMTTTFEKPLILVTDKKMTSVDEIVPVLKQAVELQKRPLLIIAEDVEGDALGTLIVNRVRAGVKVCAVKAPGFGDHRKNNLHDIAVLTGATVISDEVGLTLEELEGKYLGTCEKLTVSKDDSIILNGGGNKKKIEERVDQIRTQVDLPNNSEFEKDKLKERLAKLSGGVAVLKIGGVSEVEVNEKKDRVNDALCATKAAVEEGIIAGGGTALVYASQKLEELIAKETNFDKKVGMQIVRDAIRQPVKSISSNAGVEGAVICEKILTKNDPEWGYDAATDKFTNMFTSGIIDPKKVVRTALVNACRIAGLMITTEAIVCDEPAPRGAPQQGMGGMPPMGGGMGMDM